MGTQWFVLIRPSAASVCLMVTIVTASTQVDQSQGQLLAQGNWYCLGSLRGHQLARYMQTTEQTLLNSGRRNKGKQHKPQAGH